MNVKFKQRVMSMMYIRHKSSGTNSVQTRRAYFLLKTWTQRPDHGLDVWEIVVRFQTEARDSSLQSDFLTESIMKISLVAYDTVLIGNLLQTSRLGGALYFYRVARKRSLFILNMEEAISTVKPTRCTNPSNLFYFGMTLYMFRTVFPSIIRSSKLYIQQQASVWQMPVAVCTVLNSWWWTKRPSETCRMSFQNKINLIHWCIQLVLL